MFLRYFSTASVAALSVCLSSSAAFADITPEQVWEGWQEYMESFGYELDATEARTSDTLTLSDIRMSTEIPEEDAALTMSVTTLSLHDNGDGTVSVTIPPVMPFNLAFSGKDDSANMALEYQTTDFSMLVSGDPAVTTYRYAAENITTLLKSMIVDGKTADIGKAELSLSDLSGTSVHKKGDASVFSQQINAEGLNYDLDIKGQDSANRIAVTGEAANIAMDYQGSFPSNVDSSDIVAMLDGGFSASGDISYDDGSSEFLIEDGRKTARGLSSTGGGSLEFGMDAEALKYIGNANDLEITLTGDDFPFPVEVALGETGFNLLMPLSKRDEEQDFAFAVTLADFSMSDMIWALFDPTAQLPHDPATIAIDLTGKVKLFLDLLNSEEMARVEKGETTAGELNALDINALTVRAAGAELTGEGSFTFDNSDLTSFGGAPAPTGALDLQLIGGNGLLDKLVAMGFLPEEQASGIRLMSSIFTVTGQGEDTLKSTIEVTDEGHVKANGQRIK